MASELSAQLRNETGKGAARRARRAGQIPAVLYGHTVEENLHLNLPGHETFLIVKDNPNAIINLEVDGEKHLVLLKEIQRHPVRRDILHIDLQAVSRDEKVEVEVPLTVTGEPAPGTVINLEIFDLPVQVSPRTHLYHSFLHKIFPAGHKCSHRNGISSFHSEILFCLIFPCHVQELPCRWKPVHSKNGMAWYSHAAC